MKVLYPSAVNLVIFKKISFHTFEGKRHEAMYSSGLPCTSEIYLEHNSLREVCDVCQVFHLNIAYYDLKFCHFIAVDVLYPKVLNLVIFKNISFHTFEGKWDEAMYSRARSVHVQDK